MWSQFVITCRFSSYLSHCSHLLAGICHYKNLDEVDCQGPFKKSRLDVEPPRIYSVRPAYCPIDSTANYSSQYLRGIPTATFVTVLGSAGLAISLALQDSLKNVAGGILILFSRPFTLGDYIEVEDQAVSGTVCEIGLVYTRLNTPDNKRIFLFPTGKPVMLPSSTILPRKNAGWISSFLSVMTPI